MNIFNQKKMDQYVYDEYMRIKKETGGKDFIKIVLEKMLKEGYSFSSKESLRDACRKFAKKNNIKSEEKDFDETEEKSTYEEGNDFINIICSSKRILTKDDIIKQFNIDLNVWEIEKFILSSHEGYRKDRSVKWKVQDGKVLEGDVNDSGRMLIVPLYSVSVRLIKKKQQITKQSIDKLFENINLKDLSPISNKNYSENKKYKKSFLLPVSDLHLGLLSTKDVCGNDYNLEIAERLFYSVIEQSIEKIKNLDIKEIVFLIGNDFLNSDSLSGQTVKGTQQDNSDFWFKLMDKAIEIVIKSTNTLLQYAPVKIINVSSNHDEHTLHGIMKTLEAFYSNNKNVIVDVSPFPRKYTKIGKCLFGFVHDMPTKNLLEIMTVEGKDYWSECNKFYWLMGHLHKAMVYEKVGLLEIYRLPTISGNSRWANNSGYTQTEKKNQCFLIDEENGIEEVYNIFVE